MDELELLPRLLLAIVLGGVLGIEREYDRKPAGLRTHVIVCLSSATLMAASQLLQGRGGTIIGDPARMAQGILTGIGFIGAGTIVQQRNVVTGITTAATIWMAAAVGILCGSGFYVLAPAVTALAFVVLQVGLQVEALTRRDGRTRRTPRSELTDDKNDERPTGRAE
jgi:putative Mg2+ transporter-C (MgtC) family protein